MNRLSVDSVDNHVVHLQFFRRLAFHDVQNHVFAKLVVFGAIRFQLFQLAFELLRFLLVAEGFDKSAAGSDAQFWEQTAYQLHIRIVYPIKDHGVYTVDNYQSFNHTTFVAQNYKLPPN